MNVLFSLLASAFVSCTLAQTADLPEGSADLLVMDARTAAEFKSWHAEKAVNIPFDEVAEKIDAVALSKDQDILVYCRSGRRSGIAVKTLRRLGYTRVVNVGGLEEIKAWEATRTAQP